MAPALGTPWPFDGTRHRRGGEPAGRRLRDAGRCYADWPEDANRQLTASVLTTGDPGASAHEFLYRLNLSEQYREDPAKTIAELHEGLGQADESSRLFALAELSFDYAEHGGGHPYYLASAAYAWAFLFPDNPAARPGCYDPRVRTAMDLYNRGIAEGPAAWTRSI